MAKQLPSGLFNAYTEVLDSSPTANRYAQITARERAKKEALDEYELHRINSINPTGLRDEDREEFDGIVGALKPYYIQNKDQIRKGGTPEALEFEKMFRDAKMYPNRSKEATAKEDAILKLASDLYKRDGILPTDEDDDKAFFNDIESHRLPLNDPKRKGIDLSKWLSLSEKPFDLNNYLKPGNAIKRTPNAPKYSDVDGQPFKLTETIEETFDDKSKSTLADMAAAAYNSKPSFRRQVNSVMNNPIERIKLQDLFKKQFGGEPTTPEHYAAAYDLSIRQPVITKSKVVDNRGAIMEQQQAYAKERIELQHRNSLSRLYASFGLKEQSDENISGSIDNLIAGHIQTANNNNGEVLLDNETFKAITGQDKSSSSVLKVDSGGNYTYGRKNPDGSIEVKGNIPFQLAKAKIVDQYKGGLKKKINPNTTTNPGSQTRPPKKITDTKMAPKKGILD